MSIEPARRATTFSKWALALSAALCLVAAAPKAARWVNHEPEPMRPDGRPYTIGRVRAGTEVIAFFIGSSACAASLHPGLPGALASLRKTLAARAKAEGKSFTLVGVSLDERPEVGLMYLKRLGPFDEVSSGGSWFNSIAVDLLVRESFGAFATPQLVIVERDMVARGKTIKASPDRIVATARGSDGILAMDSVTKRVVSATAVP